MAAQQELARFADQAVCETAPVIDCQPLAPDIFRLRMECPPMARLIRPGQFLMVRIHGVDDPLIGRPLALFDTDPQSEAVDVVFVVGGNMTRRLAQLRTGDALDIWGPLGNGFSMTAADHVLLVAGGIGFTPFLAVAKSYLGWKTYGEPQRDGRASAKRVTFCFGARSASALVSLADFQSIGAEVLTSTDDGSAGHHGFVTDLLTQTLASSAEQTRRILCCGPEPMMKAVAEIALQHQIPCEVSLETPMACGIGICFTCVARIRDESGQWDYRRTCVEGPVFAGQDVCWD
jgi:dihydroorotate dehydrogenase electron transfer subunit